MRRIRDHVSYANVYLYNLSGASFTEIVENGRIIEKVIHHDTWKLQGDLLEKSLKVLSKELPGKPKEYTWCFYPRHAIVYFDRSHEIIGSVRVCFECMNYRATPPPLIEVNNIRYFKEILEQVGVPVYSNKNEYLNLE